MKTMVDLAAAKGVTELVYLDRNKPLPLVEGKAQGWGHSRAPWAPGSSVVPPADAVAGLVNERDAGLGAGSQVEVVARMAGDPFGFGPGHEGYVFSLEESAALEYLAAPPGSDKETFFDSFVRPILVAHSAPVQEAPLMVETLPSPAQVGVLYQIRATGQLVKYSGVFWIDQATGQPVLWAPQPPKPPEQQPTPSDLDSICLEPAGVSPQLPSRFKHSFLGRLNWGRFKRIFGRHTCWPMRDEIEARGHEMIEAVLARYIPTLDENPTDHAELLRELEGELGGTGA